MDIQEKSVKNPRIKDIKKIVYGDNNVLALDITGQLYVWEFGDYGQLGHRWSTRVPSYRCLTPLKLRLRGEKLTNIGSGSYHSFAIGEDGTIWGSGLLYMERSDKRLGEYTRLAMVLAYLLFRELYTLDILDDAVTDITGGENYTFARIRMGNCLVWGSGRKGQFACDMTRVDLDRNEVMIDPMDDEIAGLAEPRAAHRFLDNKPPDVEIVATAYFHNIAITEDGRLLRWGNNAGWQCGVEKREDDVVEEQDNLFITKVSLVLWTVPTGHGCILVVAIDTRSPLTQPMRSLQEHHERRGNVEEQDCLPLAKNYRGTCQGERAFLTIYTIAPHSRAPAEPTATIGWPSSFFVQPSLFFVQSSLS